MMDPLTWLILSILGIIAMAVWAHKEDESYRKSYFDKGFGDDELLNDDFLDKP